MAKRAKGFAEERQAPLMGQPLVEVGLGFKDSDTSSDAGGDGGRMTIGPGGRVVIPSEIRKAMGVAEGDTLLATLVDGELRLLSVQSALKIARDLVKSSISGDGKSVMDELWAERRRQREREERLASSS